MWDCRHRKKSFFSFLLSILLGCGLILCFPTSTPIVLDGISFLSVLCARVNILCKHVQMCVCSGMFVDIAMGMDNTRFGVATNHQKILRCDWSPMSTDFIILIKICMKTGSGTRDGFGDLVMRGEGVRHPTTSVHRRLSPSMCSCVCLIKQVNVGLLLSTNVPTLSGIH